MLLYKLVIPMRRSADLTEIAVITHEQWRSIEEHENVELYFGEVAGKHSEVRWTLDLKVPKVLKVLSEDQAEIALFRRWFPEGRIGQVSILGAIENLHEGMEEGDKDCVCGLKAPVSP